MNQLAPGKVIGQRYQLVQSIAAGGMGQVFKAVDTRLFNRPVAVKLLHQNLAGDENTRRHLLKRFQQEIRISTLLGEHPAIVKVLDYGLENNQPYLVMEYLTGRSLGELLLKQPLLPPQQVVKIARQVCAGLYYAHNLETEQDGHLIKGVIHRDIKPSNLFVLKDETLGETVKILDFGIAKLLSDVSLALGTQTTGFLGTVRYASPEQVRGEELDPRSDIYSFGVVLYRMLTGQHPLQPKSDSFPGWYEAHNYQQPQPFNRANLPYEIPLELEQVVLSCLAKDPDRRPQDMKVLSAQLEGSLQSDSSAGSALTPPPTTSPFSERTLAALDGQEGAHRLSAQPEPKGRPLPLWGGIALLAAIAGSTFWGLRLLLDPGTGMERPPAVPLPPATDGQQAIPEPLLDWLLRDPAGEPAFEDDPDPARDNPQDPPQPEPTPTPATAPAPPPTSPPPHPPLSPLRPRPDRLQCPHPLLHLLQLVSQPSLSPHSPSTNPCFPPSIGPLLLLPPPPLPKTPRPVSWNACAKSGNAWGRTRPKKKGSLRIP
ncbi:serine/threonine-protein kinase [Synechococcus sp. 65AY6A5]|uniref:serine/threonine protein kinase n=1 Tax=Synechococcus sp. 65AY6A5 TaxID=1353265 RepID=UPI0023E85B6D|nr:serine/threonine-protein kinase [Synechococcus sp. 65AY6A5]